MLLSGASLVTLRGVVPVSSASAGKKEPSCGVLGKGYSWTGVETLLMGLEKLNGRGELMGPSAPMEGEPIVGGYPGESCGAATGFPLKDSFLGGRELSELVIGLGPSSSVVSSEDMPLEDLFWNGGLGGASPSDSNSLCRDKRSGDGTPTPYSRMVGDASSTALVEGTWIVSIAEMAFCVGAGGLSIGFGDGARVAPNAKASPLRSDGFSLSRISRGIGGTGTSTKDAGGGIPLNPGCTETGRSSPGSSTSVLRPNPSLWCSSGLLWSLWMESMEIDLK